MKIQGRFICSLIFLLLGGCATPKTNIFAKDDGSFHVVSSFHSPTKAEQAAKDAADRYCQKLGKHVVNLKSTDGSNNPAIDSRMPSAVLNRDRRPGFESGVGHGNIADSSVAFDFKCE
jgi:hypothetical protein